jgi:prolyl-tRNA editing enzyme YbaK/EbsC (Cys-tRNA(Pro) deacylase)
VLGRLHLTPALDAPELLAPAVADALRRWRRADEVQVAAIDPDLADTAAFCAVYDIDLEASANCVVVFGKRGDVVRHAACVVLATTRADVNGLVRRHLDVRKASFGARDETVEVTGMEYGGITPIGLPGEWPALIDAAVLEVPLVVVGSGLRRSKLVLPGAALAQLPGAQVLADLGQPV